MIRSFTRSLLLLYGLAISSTGLMNLGHELLHEVRNEFHHHSHQDHHRLYDHHLLAEEVARDDQNNVEIVLFTCFTFYHPSFLFHSLLDAIQLPFNEKRFRKPHDGYRNLITPPPLHRMNAR